MRKYIKFLKWLFKNKEKLEALLSIEQTSLKALNTEPKYSLAGVPKNQLSAIDDILKDDTVK